MTYVCAPSTSGSVRKAFDHLIMRKVQDWGVHSYFRYAAFFLCRWTYKNEGVRLVSCARDITTDVVLCLVVPRVAQEWNQVRVGNGVVQAGGKVVILRNRRLLPLMKSPPPTNELREGLYKWERRQFSERSWSSPRILSREWQLNHYLELDRSWSNPRCLRGWSAPFRAGSRNHSWYLVTERPLSPSLLFYEQSENNNLYSECSEFVQYIQPFAKVITTYIGLVYGGPAGVYKQIDGEKVPNLSFVKFREHCS